MMDSVEHKVEDDGAILYNVKKTASGNLTASFRVFGRIVLPDGREYECDRAEVKIQLTRRKD